ncbi:hypothetical protein FGB62_130g012 [Gracilaria domingensis]|nr:hypothetical protein FGB62_130g012 [Gracilaria domingensis]
MGCARLNFVQERLSSLREALRNYIFDEIYVDMQLNFSEADPRNLFEEFVGRFWEIPLGKEYCEMLDSQAWLIQIMSRRYKVKPLLRKVASNYEEILRLDTFDHLIVRAVFPFALLSLNQDEKCVAFVRHWMIRQFYPSFREGMQDIHSLSRGGWIYGAGDRFADIFEEISLARPQHVFVPHMFALCIVKARIVAEQFELCQKLELFRSTSSGQLLGDAMDHIERFYMSDEIHLALIAEQEQQLEHYLDIVHALNPLLLPAIYNPRAYKLVDVVHNINCAFNHYSWFQRGRSLFLSTPGAFERLERRFGPIRDKSSLRRLV